MFRPTIRLPIATTGWRRDYRAAGCAYIEADAKLAYRIFDPVAPGKIKVHPAAGCNAAQRFRQFTVLHFERSQRREPADALFKVNINVQDKDAVMRTRGQRDHRVWPSLPPSSDLRGVLTGGLAAVRNKRTLILWATREYTQSSSHICQCSNERTTCFFGLVERTAD